MSNISPTLLDQIQEMNVNEKLELMVFLANSIKNNQQKMINISEKKGSLSRFIGTGKGCYLTPKDADNFIRQERDKWDY
ncbi:hypothetical protein [Cyanobacterium sp. Dongsha4]|uniref:hypothetical protein n=1 Tax=Cyanobacterium sp. DS4 TaxID=2878255 RepID=UPI002E8085F8|nr:hypothetical protein [Cyanobacterium sp. Dongsha4]WVL00642.1 hypothetical protein Dongsha4_00115 [Cyanobacterium sp. Dongsha4]